MKPPEFTALLHRLNGLCAAVETGFQGINTSVGQVKAQARLVFVMAAMALIGVLICSSVALMVHRELAENRLILKQVLHRVDQIDPQPNPPSSSLRGASLHVNLSD